MNVKKLFIIVICCNNLQITERQTPKKVTSVSSGVLILSWLWAKKGVFLMNYWYRWREITSNVLFSALHLEWERENIHIWEWVKTCAHNKNALEYWPQSIFWIMPSLYFSFMSIVFCNRETAMLSKEDQ